MFDIQQVEVLRGPQGSLYGRNSLGGAVVIRTKEPTNEAEYAIKLSAAEGNDYRLQAMASGPIIEDKLLYRFSVISADADGLIQKRLLEPLCGFLQDTGYKRAVAV